MHPFDHPVQTAPAVGAALGIDRSTLTRAHNSGALGAASYRSGDTVLIYTNHDDFLKWLEHHEAAPRTKGHRKHKNAKHDDTR